MAERLNSQVIDWPLRPWIMASLCGIAGLLFWGLTEHDHATSLPPMKQAMATFVAVATISFVLTVDRRRWTWSVAFALVWALITAFVGWFSASYDRSGDIFEWPYFAGLFATLLAAPLFQTIRDEAAWRFPYSRLHSHVWTDAIIGAASLFFTGLTFLLAWLIAGLFDVIGIVALRELLQREWFGWTLAGFAFGAAVGILREQDRLVPGLQRLAMAVLSVLAPVLAFALAAFLVSIVFTGLQGLWDSWVSATALLLAASAGAVLLINAVIADSRDECSQNAILRTSALVLAAVILPLTILAAFAMGLRIGQYGWTPERIWGAIAIGFAVTYGLGGWWAVIKARRGFDEPLRPIQTRFAIGLCALALFLALPILDFGAVSARSQLARLEEGKVEPAEFDWAAMAFDFGPAGRERLAEISRSGPATWRAKADLALEADERWTLVDKMVTAGEASELAARIRLASDGLELTPDILGRIAAERQCMPRSKCVLLRLDQNRVLLVSAVDGQRDVSSTVFDLDRPANVGSDPTSPRASGSVELESATIELRQIERRQLYVDGAPVGEPFE